MADEEQHFYDVQDAVSIERRGEPEDLAAPPVNPVELEAKYLLGMRLPGGKQAVIETARSNDAPSRVLALLERLEEREYRHVGDLLGQVEELSGERGGVDWSVGGGPGSAG